ncbi:MAG: dockerin type I repeat-containing protein [Defluviitaleaceae bacterium]|nr:dockerin type I repeat-containing protein [Defluviitaleaceae bacterium]MCL2262572.1 dockerin type I repeat-containing protein [Defluviitaleaceae bacterium]
MKKQSSRILALAMALVLTMAQVTPIGAAAHEIAHEAVHEIPYETAHDGTETETVREIASVLTTPSAVDVLPMETKPEEEPEEKVVPFAVNTTLNPGDTQVRINNIISQNRGTPITFTIPAGLTINTTGRIDIAQTDNVTFTGTGTLRGNGTGTLINMTGGGLTIDGITLTGGAGGPGMAGAIHVSPTGTGTPTLTMRSGNIVSNTAQGSGGAIHISQIGSQFEMFGGSIHNNQTGAGSQGGGVHVNNATFIMRGGTISNNTAAQGGGVNVTGTNALFRMHNGTIARNTTTATAATSGGGGVRLVSGTFNMQGGIIEDNRSARHGGGVLMNGGMMTMSAGTIRDNRLTAANSNGGGISMVSAVPTLTMAGGTITGNTATGAGGGIDVNDGSATLNGGTISNNSAAGGGGAIAVTWATVTATVQRLTIAAAVNISGNTSTAHEYTLSAEDRAFLSGRYPVAVVNLFDNHTISYTRGIRVEYSEVHFMVNSGSGTLTAWHNGAALTSPANVRAGETIHFSATPAPGYRVTNWTGHQAATAGSVFGSVVAQSGGASTAVFVNFARAEIPAPWAVTNVLGTGSPAVTERFASAASYQGGRFTMDTRGTSFPRFLDGDGTFAGTSDRLAFVSQPIPYNYNFTISGYVTLHHLMDGRTHPAGASNALYATQNTGVGFMARNQVGTGGAAQGAAYVMGGVHLSTNADINNTHPTLTNARVGRLRATAGASTVGLTNMNLIGDIELGVPFPVSLTRRGDTVTIESNGVTQTLQNFEGFTTDGGEYIYVGMVNSRMALTSFSDVVLEYYDPVIRTLEQLLAAIEAAAESGEPTVLELRGEIETPAEISIPASAYITLTGDATIHRTGSGRAMRVNGTLTADGITFTGTSAGGGIAITSSGTFIMQSGEISGNEGNNGGAVNVAANGTFIMYGGEITGNHARQNGGGVFLSNNAVFTMYGGFIAHNTPNNIAGAGADTITRNGGFIEGHTHRVTTLEELLAIIAAAGTIPTTIELYGEIVSTVEIAIPAGVDITFVGDGTLIRPTGGRILRVTGTLTLDGATISGGGVAVVSGGELIMKSGEIYENTANNGGGVNLAAGATLTMYGGKIHGNHANTNGGGIFVAADADVTLIGGAIENNTPNNIAGPGAGDVIRFGGTVGGEEAPTDFIIRTLAELRLALFGATETPRTLTIGADIEVTGDVLVVEQGTDITIIRGGDYQDLFRTDENGSVIRVYGTLTIGTNAYNGIYVSGGFSDENGGGISVPRGGELTLNSGGILYNVTTANGGGVAVLAGGRFTMNGGVIRNNDTITTASGSTRGGGGVFVYGVSGGAANHAFFTMNGGIIENNTSTFGGGGVFGYSRNNGTNIITINGGSIRNNTANAGAGGGIRADARAGSISDVVINGGYVYGNVSTANGGGGVLTTRHASFFMHGGRISENTAATTGGGIHAGFNRENNGFIMTGGEIVNNTAALSGGGISFRGWSYLSGASLAISPAAIIMGNTASVTVGLTSADALHLAEMGLHPSIIALFDNQQIEYTRGYDCTHCRDNGCRACGLIPAAPVKIAVSTEFAIQDETVDIRIKLLDNFGVSNMALRIDFPEGLTLTAIQEHSGVSGWFTTSVGALEYLDYLKAEWLCDNVIFSGDGKILTLTFRVNYNAENDFHRITASLNDDYRVTNGGINVRPRQAGDASGDGRVTSADATIIARYLVGQGVTIDRRSADINGDGYVTVADLTLLARWLAGHNVENLIAF